MVALARFEVFLAPTDDYLLNFAVPTTPDPDDWSPDVSSLDALFAGRGRWSRIEYFHELHPQLASALELVGFLQDSRAPVMVLEHDAFAPVAGPVMAPYRRLQRDDEAGARAFLSGQDVAYGAVGGAECPWLPTLMEGLRRKGMMAAGLEQEGEFIAGATIQIGGGVGELAGVWTAPSMRRQGLAYAVCRRLLGEYFEAGGDLCWLSSAEGASRLYEKLGFSRVGTQLNYGRSSIRPASALHAD